MFPSKNPKNLPTSIKQYLDPQLVVFLEVDDRDSVLQEMVDRLELAGKLKDKKAFFNAIWERERIVSTAIGMGVAIPHAKLPGYETFFIAIGVHRRGITWESLDGIPVRLVFMIGGPDDKQTEYLQLLSRLTQTIKDEEKRKKILQSRSGEEIIAFFEGG